MATLSSFNSPTCVALLSASPPSPPRPQTQWKAGGTKDHKRKAGCAGLQTSYTAQLSLKVSINHKQLCSVFPGRLRRRNPKKGVPSTCLPICLRPGGEGGVAKAERRKKEAVPPSPTFSYEEQPKYRASQKKTHLKCHEKKSPFFKSRLHERNKFRAKSGESARVSGFLQKMGRFFS